jgi:peptidoglycan/LPS O-acetylase OafA/YrhL
LAGADALGASLVLTAIGIIGIVGSIVLYTTVHSDEAFAYRGGFLIAALAASAVLLSVSCAQFSPVARLLSFPPFTFIGRISYGMYLWHFPLFTFINALGRVSAPGPSSESG